jgi:hypothetical protein
MQQESESMNQLLCHESLPSEIKRPLRITLTLITRRMDIGSLDPLSRALLDRATFESAQWQMTRAQGQSLTVLSDQGDLAITYPQQDSRIAATSVMVAAAVLGLVFLPLNAPLLWLVVVWAGVALTKTLNSLSSAIEVTVRGDLADVVTESGALALWISEKKGRRSSLEVWDRVHVQAEARRPEEVEAMFELAAEVQEHGAR